MMENKNAIERAAAVGVDNKNPIPFTADLGTN